jgi:hypothetical protein
MFILRHHHMEALQAYARDQYARRAAADLRNRFPHRCEELGGEDLLAVVRAGIERAARYGITTETAVFLFLALFLAHGRDFETRKPLAWTRAILEDAQLDGAVKVALIYDRMPPALRPEDDRPREAR